MNRSSNIRLNIAVTLILGIIIVGGVVAVLGIQWVGQAIRQEITEAFPSTTEVSYQPTGVPQTGAVEAMLTALPTPELVEVVFPPTATEEVPPSFEATVEIPTIEAVQASPLPAPATEPTPTADPNAPITCKNGEPCIVGGVADDQNGILVSEGAELRVAIDDRLYQAMNNSPRFVGVPFSVSGGRYVYTLVCNEPLGAHTFRVYASDGREIGVHQVILVE